MTTKQTFATSNLPIKKLDFSHNAIRRLSDKAFNGIQVRNDRPAVVSAPSLFDESLKSDTRFLTIRFEDARQSRGKINFLLAYLSLITFSLQDTLIELRLTDNLLGDSLNPIFSTVEFQSLVNLQVLDLSGNKIKAIEEGILKGCTKLDVSLSNLKFTLKTTLEVKTSFNVIRNRGEKS